MLVRQFVEHEAMRFNVGDILEFNLIDGEAVQALAVDKTATGMTFVLIDCIRNQYPMIEAIEEVRSDDVSYDNSDLKKILNDKIIQRFPTEIRDCMIPVNFDGDLLRIPTEREIFGKNICGQNEKKETRYWGLMDRKRNRIALRGLDGEYTRYWLMNRDKEYSFLFAVGYLDGSVAPSFASESIGVRPVFVLSQ